MLARRPALLDKNDRIGCGQGDGLFVGFYAANKNSAFWVSLESLDLFMPCFPCSTSASTDFFVLLHQVFKNRPVIG
jgi:hypothetical protein